MSLKSWRQPAALAMTGRERLCATYGTCWVRIKARQGRRIRQNLNGSGAFVCMHRLHGLQGRRVRGLQECVQCWNLPSLHTPKIVSYQQMMRYSCKPCNTVTTCGPCLAPAASRAHAHEREQRRAPL